MMKFLIVFASVLAIACAGGFQQGFVGLNNNQVFARSPVVAATTSSQYHTQDELGQYSYGYSGPLSSKQESKIGGITRGGYSYVDANGITQHVSYVADDVNGIRIAGTNLPVGPAAPAQVVAATPVFRSQQIIAQPAAQIAQVNYSPQVNYAPAAPVQVARHYQPGPLVQNFQAPLRSYPEAPIVQNFQTAPIAGNFQSGQIYSQQQVNFDNRAPIPRIPSLNYGAAPPQLTYSQQAPLIRQVSAGFGGPIHIAQLPQQVDDTIEVKAAKANFFQSYKEALARNG